MEIIPLKQRGFHMDKEVANTPLRKDQEKAARCAIDCCMHGRNKGGSACKDLDSLKFERSDLSNLRLIHS